MKPTITIGIVNYFTSDLLPKCLDSVFSQKTDFPIEVTIYNNSPKDHLIKIKKRFPGIKIIENGDNLGFAEGHNILIESSQSTYYLALNPDVILEPLYVEACVGYLESNTNTASVTGKLLWYDQKSNKKTDIIDSTGIVKQTVFHYVDRGMGEKDTGQFDHSITVYGASGAAALYRRDALNQIKDQYGYFDRRFFIYKEDIELAWKLQVKGFTNAFNPHALAYHVRGSGLIKNNAGLLSRILHKKNSAFSTIYYSFRNTLLLYSKQLLYDLRMIKKQR